MKRFTVYVANEGFVGYGSRPSYTRAPTKYPKSDDPQAARVFYREADAKRVAKATGGEVVPVVLWYGPHAPHGAFPS